MADIERLTITLPSDMAAIVKDAVTMRRPVRWCETHYVTGRSSVRCNSRSLLP